MWRITWLACRIIPMPNLIESVFIYGNATMIGKLRFFVQAVVTAEGVTGEDFRIHTISNIDKNLESIYTFFAWWWRHLLRDIAWKNVQWTHFSHYPLQYSLRSPVHRSFRQGIRSLPCLSHRLLYPWILVVGHADTAELCEFPFGMSKRSRLPAIHNLSGKSETQPIYHKSLTSYLITTFYFSCISYATVISSISLLDSALTSLHPRISDFPSYFSLISSHIHGSSCRLHLCYSTLLWQSMLLLSEWGICLFSFRSRETTQDDEITIAQMFRWRHLSFNYFRPKMRLSYRLCLAYAWPVIAFVINYVRHFFVSISAWIFLMPSAIVL